MADADYSQIARDDAPVPSHRPTKPAPPVPPKPSHNARLYAGGAVVAMLLVGGGFAAGMQYQKVHGVTTTAAAGMGPGGFGGSSTGGSGFGGRMRSGGGIGAVTAVSSSSITIKSPRSGASTTYAIDSSTVVSNQGATASISDITTGDTVIVVPSTSDSKTAGRIILGGFGGGAGMRPPSGQSNN